MPDSDENCAVASGPLTRSASACARASMSRRRKVTALPSSEPYGLKRRHSASDSAAALGSNFSLRSAAWLAPTRASPSHRCPRQNRPPILPPLPRTLLPPRGPRSTSPKSVIADQA